MGDSAVIYPGKPLDRSLRRAAHAILESARDATAEPNDAVAIHDVRRAFKRWRAFLRLLAPTLGERVVQMRNRARDLARELGEARDVQAALDALGDLRKSNTATKSATLSDRTFASMSARLEKIREDTERGKFGAPGREALVQAIADMDREVETWRCEAITFAELAAELAQGYRRARRRRPKDWAAATADDLHELRQAVVVHRYQMELLAPLWPRLNEAWTQEAQRLRSRLGRHQDLTLLVALTAPRQPLAPWRSRLAPMIERRAQTHVAAAEPIATRLFAEGRRAFRDRIEVLWVAGGGRLDRD